MPCSRSTCQAFTGREQVDREQGIVHRLGGGPRTDRAHRHALYGIGFDDGPGARNPRLVAAHHHRELAGFGAGDPAAHGGIHEPHLARPQPLGQLSRGKRVAGGCIDQQLPGPPGAPGGIGHSPDLAGRRQTGDDDVHLLHQGPRGIRHPYARRLRELQGSRRGAIPDHRLEPPGHMLGDRPPDRTQPDKPYAFCHYAPSICFLNCTTFRRIEPSITRSPIRTTIPPRILGSSRTCGMTSLALAALSRRWIASSNCLSGLRARITPACTRFSFRSSSAWYSWLMAPTIPWRPRFTTAPRNRMNASGARPDSARSPP